MYIPLSFSEPWYIILCLHEKTLTNAFYCFTLCIPSLNVIIFYFLQSLNKHKSGDLWRTVVGMKENRASPSLSHGVTHAQTMREGTLV